jgi:deoxyribodipyrimidine photolyase-related protein
MRTLLLFPNQLFEITILKNVQPTHIIFIEDYHFYGRKKMTLNPLRITYMDILHKTYIELLQQHFNVVYHKRENFNFDYTKIKNAIYFDPCDISLERHLSHLQRYESPSFIISRDEIETLHIGKRLQHSHFYNFVKKKLNILEDVKNMDKYNRKQYSKNIPLPKEQFRIEYTSPSTWNSPHSDYLSRLPITHANVANWTDRFFKERFENYGTYQDVVYDKDPLLYHSGLSIYLNNGLITPLTIIKIAEKYKKCITSYEGFIRQIIGWREYARFYYYRVKKVIYNQNPFKQYITKLPKNWGDEIPIVKKAKEQAMKYGYLNHIQRLMVVSNYMTLSGYHPNLIYKWMFEFALDSYEWVMIFNCYSMASYSDNGFAMRKPYICSSKYLLRMSNEPKGEWEDKWDKLYSSFLKKQKTVLDHTPLAKLF